MEKRISLTEKALKPHVGKIVMRRSVSLVNQAHGPIGKKFTRSEMFDQFVFIEKIKNDKVHVMNLHDWQYGSEGKEKIPLKKFDISRTKFFFPDEARLRIFLKDLQKEISRVRKNRRRNLLLAKTVEKLIA